MRGHDAYRGIQASRHHRERGAYETPGQTAVVNRDKSRSLPSISTHTTPDLVEKGGYPS